MNDPLSIAEDWAREQALPTATENWAPYKDGYEAAEKADEYREALAKIQWRGWNEYGGYNVCPLCRLPEKDGRHDAGCVIGEAVNP